MVGRTMGTGRAAARRLRRLGGQAGQGTVEYVALMLLVGAIMTAVIGAGGGTSAKTIADKVTSKIASSVDGVKGKGAN
jgi:hypothetical protein